MSAIQADGELIWRIAGGSGDGQISIGQQFAKALMRSGLNVFTHQHYTSRIRGGHIFVEVRAAEHEVTSRGDEFNFLVALGDSYARNPSEDAYYGNEEIKPLTENLADLREGGIIVYDSGMIDIDEIPHFQQRVEANGWQVYGIDLRGIARNHGREVMRNVAGLGATVAFLDMELDPLIDVLEESMSDSVLDANRAVLSEAYEHVVHKHNVDSTVQLATDSHDEPQVMISGSDAVAYGAIDSGCRFIAGYPMTPWTGVFSTMSQYLPRLGGIAEQVEDEIAAAALAIGASHAGVKSMSGSSGGGFALMSEPLGLAEMTETPVVFVEAMRGGPSTGMPTKPEQSDLEHVLYTSQGDSNRVVFAPGNIREAYEQTRHAFDIAYEYQIPAIIIIDQKLSSEYRNLPHHFFDRDPNPDLGSVVSESDLEESIQNPSSKFRRFRHDAPDGVSPRPLPGQKGGRFLATGNEHNEAGHISEDPANRVSQVDRRLQKGEAIRESLDSAAGSHQSFAGPSDAHYGIITWGSQQGTVEEAASQLNNNGYSVKSLSVSDLMPFPKAELRSFLNSVEAALVVEMNASAQFRGLIHKELETDCGNLSSLLKYNGNPFEPGEIVEGFEALTKGHTVSDSETKYIPAGGD